MNDFFADPSSTLAAARDEYFSVNKFGADGGYTAKWVEFKLGPIPMPLPNTASRVRAVRFHDLHHALTGYHTDTLGEFEISAWEIGSGCADLVAAWVLNLSGLVGGLLSIPRRTWRAFLRGRQTRNLYRRQYDDALLSRRVADMRHELGLEQPLQPARPTDVAWFASAILSGLVIGSAMLVFMVPTAVIANIAALFRHR